MFSYPDRCSQCTPKTTEHYCTRFKGRSSFQQRNKGQACLVGRLYLEGQLNQRPNTQEPISVYPHTLPSNILLSAFLGTQWKLENSLPVFDKVNDSGYERHSLFVLGQINYITLISAVSLPSLLSLLPIPSTAGFSGTKFTDFSITSFVVARKTVWAKKDPPRFPM